MRKTVKVTLRARKNSDGTHTIRIRTIKDREATFTNIGERIHRSYWDDNKQRVKPSHPDAIRINKRIEQFLPKFQSPQSVGDFINYWNEYIDKLVEKNKIGEAGKHRTSRNIFKRFMGENVDFDDLTYDKMKDYVQYLYSTYDNPNSAYSYLKKVRMICKIAYREDRLYFNPFAKIKTKEPKPSEPRALTQKQFQELSSYPRDISSIGKYINVWLASFYLQGARVGDILRLKFKDIMGEQIRYQMQKTEYKMSVEMVPQFLNLIIEINKGRFEFYDSHSSWGKVYEIAQNYPDEYIFPFLKNGVHNVPRMITRGERKGVHITGKEAEYKAVASFTAVINKNLKKLNTLIGTKLTMHTARHTFATLANSDLKDVYEVMMCLGHKDIRNTQGYLNSLHSEERSGKVRSMYDRVSEPQDSNEIVSFG